MIQKTRTIVVIKTHDQAAIRRSRRITSSQMVTLTPIADTHEKPNSSNTEEKPT